MVDWPVVSVVIPVRNGARHLPRCLDAVLGQQYSGDIDVALAVPSSGDDSDAAAACAAADASVTVVRSASGEAEAALLNDAIGATSGTIVAHVPCDTVIPPDYLRRAVAVLRESGADNVGGVREPERETPLDRAVAAAMRSPLGVGNPGWRSDGAAGRNATVHPGVFRREALERVGGFDQTLERNHVADLNWRIRDTDGVVWFDPQLRVRDQAGSTLVRLARQYFTFGSWKREVLRRDRASVRWRQFVPAAVVLANAAGVSLGLLHRRWWLAVPASYAASTIAASAVAAGSTGLRGVIRLPLVFATMHHAWGLGFLLSRRRSPGSER